MSSLVGSSRRSQTGCPYSLARPSSTNGTRPGRVRSSRRTQVLIGSGLRRRFVAAASSRRGAGATWSSRPADPGEAAGPSRQRIGHRRIDRARRSPHATSGRRAGGDRGLERDRRPVDGDDLDAERRRGRRALRFDAAADRDAAHAGGLRPSGDAEGRLAERGLGIDPALAGDDDVGPGELGVEAGLLGDEVDSRRRARAIGTGRAGRAGRTRRRRPRRRRACRARGARWRPRARSAQLGQSAGRDPRPGRRSPLSAARTSQPRRSDRAAGS